MIGNLQQVCLVKLLHKHVVSVFTEAGCVHCKSLGFGALQKLKEKRSAQLATMCLPHPPCHEQAHEHAVSFLVLGGDSRADGVSAPPPVTVPL